MDSTHSHCIPDERRIDVLENTVNNLSITAGNAFGVFRISTQPDVEATIVHDIATFIAGTNIAFTCDAGAKSITIDAGDIATQDTFKFVAVSGQTTIQADQPADTLTVVGTGGIVVTTSYVVDTTHTLTIDGSAFSQLAFKTIATPSGSAVADIKDDTLTLAPTTVNSPVLISATDVAGADKVFFDVNVDGTTISKSGGVLSAVGGAPPPLGCGLHVVSGNLVVDFNDGLDCVSNHLKFNPETDTHLNFDTSTPKKARVDWAGMSDYDASAPYPQLLGHETSEAYPDYPHWHTFQEWARFLPNYNGGLYQTYNNETDGGDDSKMKWEEAKQVTIWGLDPGGGHTLTVSGTTVTITLKTIHHTFRCVGSDTTAASDVTITHTGTACS